MYSMDRWVDKVALVTGASSGIGRAVAGKLSRLGMRVAVCARTGTKLSELMENLDPPEAHWLQQVTDLRQPEQIRDLFAAIRDLWGGVDVLINNAGVAYKSPLTEGDLKRWQEMVDLNILALNLCTFEAITDMRRRGDLGYILNISSIAAYRHKPGAVGNAVYVATKHAVSSLTESLRIELRKIESSIRISSISPGLVETHFAPRFLQDEEAGKAVYQKFKPLQPEDIAEMVCFILSTPPHVQIHDIIVRPTEQQD
jgi:NADP-dependent 3-hydroxy acid dehydrogenase YdfG